MRLAPGLALVPLALSVPAFAQNVIVVDAAAGPGSDYTDLTAAIAAANAGDILLLRSGDYACTQSTLPGIAGFAIGKSLALHGDTGAQPVLTSTLRVHSLPASSWTTLRGLAIRTPFVPVLDGATLYLQSCAGAVRIEDVDVGPNGAPFFGATVEVLACPNAALSRVEVDAGDAPQSALFNGSPALGWTASQGSVHASILRAHANGATSDGAHGYFGGSGLQLQSGQVFVSASTLLGGDAGDSGLLQGGTCGGGADGGDAVELAGVGTILTSQACAFLPGAGGDALAPCSDGDPGVPVSQPVGVHVSHGGFPRLLEAASPVREGQNVVVKFYGQNDDVVFLMFSGAPASVSVPGIVGPLLLSAPNVKLIGNLFAGGSSPVAVSKTAFFPTHDLGAGVEGVQVRMQAAFLNPTHGTFFSNESDLLLLDASL
ncbi:MAG: hypothetical protein EPO68_04330 [Planctomycetota bacterium]|nr:MAG: hypothetical protein EPO68_04330 [Planctomycetota bacterium]